MRIAQLMLARGFGGAERSFVDLCSELVARRHDVLAVCEARSAARSLLSAVPGLIVETVRVWGAWDPLARVALTRALRAHRADVVQCHLARAAHLGGSAARYLELPTIAKTHNYVDLKYYHSIDRLVPTTRSQEDYLLSQGVVPARIARIPNFSRIPVREPVPRSVNSPLRVLALGRLVEKKGFDVLLKALSMLSPVGPPVELTIAGDGPLRSALEGQTRMLPSRIKVRLVGWVERIAPLFETTDLFVLPSRHEPFGIVVLEAMASGVPIVATETAGPLEILGPENALLVPIGDPRALAESIAECLDDPKSAHARARRASETFRNEYSADVVVPRYEALYATLIHA